MMTKTAMTRGLGLMAVSAVVVMLWQLEAYFSAMLFSLLAVGLVLARPTIESRQLRLRGTPVLLMFAVMCVAAAGMIGAVDQLLVLLNPALESGEAVSSAAIGVAAWGA